MAEDFPRASAERFEMSFQNDVWLRHNPLDARTALDYFALSPFYDRSCNNEIVRQQHQSLDALRTLQGLEFVLARTGHEPRLFVVVRQRRANETVAAKEAVYYILDRVIFQAPNAHALVLSSVRVAADRLATAFCALRADAVDDSPLAASRLASNEGEYAEEGHAFLLALDALRARVVDAKRARIQA